jgi:membrane associated rhomboid family serine protease
MEDARNSQPQSRVFKLQYSPRPALSFGARLGAFIFSGWLFADFLNDGSVHSWIILALAICVITAAILQAMTHDLELDPDLNRLKVSRRWPARTFIDVTHPQPLAFSRHPGSLRLDIHVVSDDSSQLLWQVPSLSEGQAQKIEAAFRNHFGYAPEKQRPYLGVQSWKSFTGILQGLNIAVFLGLLALEYYNGVNPTSLFDLRANAVESGEVWRVFTYMFLHANFIHLFFNMAALGDLGALLNELLGTKKLAILYFGTGIFGGIWALPWLGATPAVGASGAIFGLLGALCYLTFRAPQLGFDPTLLPTRSSLIRVLILNGLISLLPFISLAAHFGGFIAGLAVCWWQTRAKPNQRAVETLR